MTKTSDADLIKQIKQAAARKGQRVEQVIVLHNPMYGAEAVQVFVQFEKSKDDDE